MLSASLLSGFATGLLGRLGSTADPRVEKAEDWVKRHYRAYPKGIEKFSVSSREDAVVIVLDDPLDLDLFESIVNNAGYDTEISMDDGHRIINLFDVQEGPGDRRSKRLRGTFHERRWIPLGKNPVRNGEDVPKTSRMNFVVLYLSKKYSA